MHNRKHRDYRRHLHELEIEQRILYCPLVWSTWGRAHPETQVILRSLAVQAARRHGLRDYNLVLRRTHVAIGVQLVRRAVRMVNSCTPFLHDAEARLLLADSDPDSNPLPRTREITLFEGVACAR